MRIAEIMSTPSATCGPDANLTAVAELMRAQDCGFVPVVGACAGVVGVVTDRDVCIASATGRRLPGDISAAQAMTSPVHTCLSADRPGDALAVMKRFRVRRLAVIDQRGQLQGVVSMNDIVRASERTGEPEAKDIVSALAAICACRPAAQVAGWLPHAGIDAPRHRAGRGHTGREGI